MSSLTIIRNDFRAALDNKPRGLSQQEFTDIVSTLIESIENRNPEHFARLDFWLRHPDLDAKIVCANVELPRFEVLAVQKERNNSLKNSSPFKETSLSDPSKITRFLNRLRIIPNEINRRGSTVEAHAKLIDKWIVKYLESKSRIDLPNLEDISEEGNIGNDRASSMKYISVKELIDCITESENASALRSYAMNLMAAFRIYQDELIIAKDRAMNIKDDRIDSLESMLMKVLKNTEVLVGDNQELKETAARSEFNLKKVGSRLDTVVHMLKEKCVVSTMNPKDSSLHHYFLVMGYEFIDKDTGKNGRYLVFISGQKVNVRRAMRKKLNDLAHNWTVQIKMHYNANPIDLRNNVKDHVNTHISKRITEINTKRQSKIDKYNEKLKKKIDEYNKQNPKNFIDFHTHHQKKKFQPIRFNDILIECNKRTASYIENEYISYDELLETIQNVDVKTKTSPYQSENNSDTDSSSLEENSD